MNPVVALLALVALVAVASAGGLVWKRRTGRVRQADASSRVVVRPADVGAGAPFGERGTLLQFSTEFCTYCPATRRLLSGLAGSRAGLVHVDVDLSHAPDVAQRFDVLQTPTTLVLDGAGIVRARIGGPPKPRELEAELDRLFGGHRVAV